MKISDLAALSGQSIPTLKFYIREGLLPPGEATAKNRAEYGEAHVARLDLIRVLKDELQMSLERIKEVLAAGQDGGMELLRSGLDAAQAARHGASTQMVSPELTRAHQELMVVMKRLGWNYLPHDPALGDAAQALATILRVLPGDHPDSFLEPYAQAMKAIADQEIPDDFDPLQKPWEALRFAVLGTYLYEPLILALRRMAHGERATELARAQGARSAEDELKCPAEIEPEPAEKKSAKRKAKKNQRSKAKHHR